MTLPKKKPAKKSRTADAATIRGTVYFPPQIHADMETLVKAKRLDRKGVKPGIRVTLNMLMVDACRAYVASENKRSK